MNTMIDSNSADQRRERVLDDVGEDWHALRCVRRFGRSGEAAAGAARPSTAAGSARCALRRSVRLDPEHPLGLHRIVPAVAPRVAPEQPPHREHQAPKYAVLPDRIDRIARARRLVLAAPRHRRREHPLVDDDRREHNRPGDRAGAVCGRRLRPSRPRGCSRTLLLGRRPRRWRSPALGDQLGERRVEPGQALALGQLARLRAGHDDDVLSGAQLGLSAERTPRAAAASRGCARRRHRPCGRPTDPAADARRRIGERVEHEMAVGRRAPLPVHTLELGAARQAATAGRSRLHRAAHRQVERRLRPLSRRRFSVRRPARVRMRPRNPWARARLRFFGW